MDTKTLKTSTPTKDKLMDVATQLMLTKGFVATTVDEICEESKVTKGSFFHYFESKEDLTKQILEQFTAKGSQTVQKSCCDVMDPLDRVYRFLECLCSMPEKTGMRGCLLGTLAQEISSTHPELRALCDKGFSKMTQAIAKDLEAAKAKYSPKVTFNAQELAEYFLSVFQGSMIVMKAQKNPEILEKNHKHLKNYLRMIFGR